MTIKQLITQYLEEQGDWTFGGKIEDHIRSLAGAKASNASRRCRELENGNVVERRLIHLEGKQVVQYRIKQEPKVEYFPSKTRAGIFYKVIDLGSSLVCNCEGFEYRRNCTHVKSKVKQMQSEANATLF